MKSFRIIPLLAATLLAASACDYAETVTVYGKIFFQGGEPAAGIEGNLVARFRNIVLTSQSFVIAPDGSYAAIFDVASGGLDGTEHGVVRFEGNVGNLIESRLESMSPELSNHYSEYIRSSCVQELTSADTRFKVDTNSASHESFERDFVLNFGVEQLQEVRNCQEAALNRAELR